VSGVAAILHREPPSTSGLGLHPFKVAARVRIPSGVFARRSPLGFASHDDFVGVLTAIVFGRRRQSRHRRRMVNGV
jgi:hypothetical protein